jgi:hypothetical protein
MVDRKGTGMKMNRRQFVQRACWAWLTGLAAVYLPACVGDQAEELADRPRRAIDAAREAADPCNNLSKLTPDERAVRTTFNYEPLAKDPTKLCATCNFWVPDPHGGLCGTCTLVKGPIHPKASCRSWAERPRARS